MRHTTVRVVVSLALGAGLVVAGRAQPPKGPAEQQAHAQQLAFLVGRWEGEGWIDVASGERRTFRESETVVAKLDGTVLLIEGVGRAPAADPRQAGVVHDALALISWDEAGQVYRLQSHEASGRAVDAEGRLADGAFIWSFPAGPARQVRFTIRLDARGRWEETGEMGAGAPVTWQKFFEMTLAKAPAAP